MAFNASLITTDAVAVTPSDTDAVSFFGFYVGSTGNVAVVPSASGVGGTPVIFYGVPTGQIIPLAVCQIMNTDTTATEIVGFGPK